MMSFCNGCQKEVDFKDIVFVVAREKATDLERYCRSCRNPISTVHDVYWDGKPEINLADDPSTGKPIVFSSKGEKARYLKERGLVEAGDRKHGAPIEMVVEEKKESRSKEDVMRALQHVRNMGKDYRRQQYLKIMKEGQRYA